MAYDGQLKANEVFASLFNMIISLQVFGTDIGSLSGLYSGRKVDGTLYGDTKLYISTDALKTYLWDGSDGTLANQNQYNLLTVLRPPQPIEEALTIDQFRQIPVTVDEYLTKRAFTNEGTFSSFNGVILAWLNVTKTVYEHTTYNSHLMVSGLSKATSLGTINLKNSASGFQTGNELYKWRAQELFRQIEDSIAELNEPSREYNDHGFLRNYSIDDFEIIAPRGVLSGVKKHDAPYLFHPDDKPKFKEIHWKYFGVIDKTGATLTDPNTNIRSLYEMDYTVGGTTTHVLPGDLLPDGATYAANKAYTCSFTSRPSINSASYTILLMHKRDYPIMSAFTVGTSFFNARRLDINHYLTFGHNDVLNAHLGEFALLKFAVDATDDSPVEDEV